MAEKKKSAVKEKHSNGISKYADDLLKLLRKEDQSLKDLSFAFNISKEKVAELAEDLSTELQKKGYDVRAYVSADGIRYLTLARSEDVSMDPMLVPLTKRKMRIAFISEIRIGALQAQLSLTHWLYKMFEREEVDFVVLVGGLTVGVPTRTLQLDIFKSDVKRPTVLTDYVVKHFPRSKSFKTHIISNRRELDYRKKYGVNSLNLIAQQREDLAVVGDLERTFDVRGVRIKVMSPWDDNSPKGLSYGLQKIVDGLSDKPAPNIIVVGGMHTRCELPDYGQDGVHIYSVSSLHTQMRRQKAKGVHPHLGCLILELEFNKDWTFDYITGLKAHHINLDDYVVKNDCYASLEDFGLNRMSKPYQRILGWFLQEEKITEGELSRRLNKSKAFVRKVIQGLERKCKTKIPFIRASKQYELQEVEKKAFKPISAKYEDVFRFLSKSGGLACTHYGSKHDLPHVVRMAYKDAASVGVRRIFHAGDVTDGPGASGYRGHQNDVKMSDMDAMEDHAIAQWPREKFKVDPKNPIVMSRMKLNEQGQPTYEEYTVKDGEVYLQTYLIDGNHDCWAVMALGHRPARTLAQKLPDLIRFIGPADGNINMDGAILIDGVYNRNTHGDGGLGYTISTKLQKHMAAHRRRGASNGTPTVLWYGNWHTNFLLFEDMLGILLACFKSEDEFHLRHDLVSWVGMNIVEVYADSKNNLTRVVSDYRNYRSHAITNK